MHASVALAACECNPNGLKTPHCGVLLCLRHTAALSRPGLIRRSIEKTTPFGVVWLPRRKCTISCTGHRTSDNLINSRLKKCTLLSQRPLCPIFLEIMDVMEIMESHSVHYLHTVQNFMRHFVRQFFAFFQKCEPTSYGKLHICSLFLSPVKRGVNRYGFRPVFSVFYFIISIPF